MQENHNDEYLDFDLKAMFDTDLEFKNEKESSTDVLPESIVLENFPNPFNPSTNICFTLPERKFVDLRIFDVLGRQVVNLSNKELSAGTHHIVWDGRNSVGIDVAAGIYFASLKTGASYRTIKLLLVR